MESDIKYLKERFGNESHFKVPEGYFENLTSQVMERLPERKAKLVSPAQSFWTRNRFTFAVAACICACVFGATIYINSLTQNSQATPIEASIHNSPDYSTIDCVADYTMIDNEDIYALVSEY